MNCFSQQALSAEKVIRNAYPQRWPARKDNLLLRNIFTVMYLLPLLQYHLNEWAFADRNLTLLSLYFSSFSLTEWELWCRISLTLKIEEQGFCSRKYFLWLVSEISAFNVYVCWAWGSVYGEVIAFVRPPKTVENIGEGLGTGVFLEVRRRDPISLILVFRPAEVFVCQKACMISPTASLYSCSHLSFQTLL